MTDNCLKEVDQLQQESELFCDMTVEQLLFACVSGTGAKDTLWTLMNTDWRKYCPDAVAKFDD